MERANQWAQISEVGDRVRFQLANATVSLDHMLSSYPGGVELVTIQVCEQMIVNTWECEQVGVNNGLWSKGIEILWLSDASGD